jgi:hypothetical protein
MMGLLMLWMVVGGGLVWCGDVCVCVATGGTRWDASGYLSSRQVERRK